MLKTQAIGNVGRDPEIKTASSGTTYASLSLATNKKVRGEKITTWVSVTVFGDKRVEFIQGYIRKGAKLFVEGDGQARAYIKDGEARPSFEITVGAFDGKLELLSDGDAAPTQDRVTRPAPTQSQPAVGSSWNALDDDVPF